LDAQVEVLNVDVEIRKNELLLDQLPDDAGHLITIDIDNGVLNLDFLVLHSSKYLFDY
jgi:hypothetical protein